MYSHYVGNKCNSHVSYKPVPQEGKHGLSASKMLEVKQLQNLLYVINNNKWTNLITLYLLAWKPSSRRRLFLYHDTGQAPGYQIMGFLNWRCFITAPPLHHMQQGWCTNQWTMGWHHLYRDRKIKHSLKDTGEHEASLFLMDPNCFAVDKVLR